MDAERGPLGTEAAQWTDQGWDLLWQEPGFAVLRRSKRFNVRRYLLWSAVTFGLFLLIYPLWHLRTRSEFVILRETGGLVFPVYHADPPRRLRRAALSGSRLPVGMRHPTRKSALVAGTAGAVLIVLALGLTVKLGLMQGGGSGSLAVVGVSSGLGTDSDGGTSMVASAEIVSPEGERESATVPANVSATSTPAPVPYALKLQWSREYQQGGQFIVEGEVTNTTADAMQGVVAVVEVYREDGTLARVGQALTDRNPIPSAGASTFKVVTAFAPLNATCKIKFQHLAIGTPILTYDGRPR